MYSSNVGMSTLTIAKSSLWQSLLCKLHGVSTLVAGCHSSEVHPATPRAQLTTQRENTKPLPTRWTLLALASYLGATVGTKFLLGILTGTTAWGKVTHQILLSYYTKLFDVTIMG